MARTLLSASALASSSELIPEVLEGQTLQKTVRQQRNDGTFLDLAVQVVPLTIDNTVRGAYMIYQDISDQIRASEMERSQSESLGKFVNQLQLRAHEMALLNEMRDLLECCANPAEASKVVAESVQKLFPQACSGSLYLSKSSTDLADATVHWGAASLAQPFLTMDSCWCLRRGQPHWSEHSGNGVKCSHLMEDSNATSLCVPMMAQGHTLGVFCLGFASGDCVASTGHTETLRASLQLLAVSVAGQTAMAFSSLNLRHKLQEQCVRDPLTELFNRRFMEESLERALMCAARSLQPLSVILIDVDHFKGFNDRFGHNAGDRVLQSIADLLRTFFRASDICCRHGGEEFAIILPDSSLQNAVVRANALRTEVKRINLHYDNQDLGPVTVSMGVAAFPDHGETSDALLKTADRCLYESKASGRNIVTAAAGNCAPLLPQTVSAPTALTISQE